MKIERKNKINKKKRETQALTYSFREMKKSKESLHDCEGRSGAGAETSDSPSYDPSPLALCASVVGHHPFLTLFCVEVMS